MNIILFFVLIPIIFLVDYLWIGLLGHSLYTKELAPFVKLDASGSMMVRSSSALAVYVLMSLGLSVFVLPLVSALGSTLSTFLYGALFGLVLYGVYDFTNYAIFPDYSLKILVIDILWGSLLCGLITVLAVYLSRFI